MENENSWRIDLGTGGLQGESFLWLMAICDVVIWVKYGYSDEVRKNTKEYQDAALIL